MNGHNCSFCGASEDEQNVLVGDSDKEVYICEACWKTVGRLLDMPVQEQAHKKVAKGKADSGWDEMSPEKIKAHLDLHIIGQERAKKVLSVAVYNHYKMLDYAAKHANEERSVTVEKSNILMLGPSGVGKTAIIKALAHILNVPFAITDATTMTENGYVGADPESCIQRLLRAADGDVALAEKGIVYIDEIDKLACKGENLSITRDVSGEGVQQALLKIIEGTHLDLQPEGSRRHPMSETVDIDTSNILFIVGGAFVGIENIIRNRVEKKKEEAKPLGFCVKREAPEETNCLSFNEVIDKAVPEDLRKYGIIPELLGRLPVTAPLHELRAEDLCRILTEPKNSLVKQYKEMFRCDNVELRFSEGALHAVAERAIRNGTGARGLRAIMENVLLEQMYTIKQHAKGKVLVITKRDIDRAFADSDRKAKTDYLVG